MYGRRTGRTGISKPKPTLEQLWKRECKPHIARLWQLLEQDSISGERRAVTSSVLRNEVLPLCVTRYETARLQAWIDDLELDAASNGSIGMPIKRSTFHARLHKEMFAPLIKKVENESQLCHLRSSFVDVICSVERRRRWQKLEDRFALSRSESLSVRKDTIGGSSAVSKVDDTGHQQGASRQSAKTDAAHGLHRQIGTCHVTAGNKEQEDFKFDSSNGKGGPDQHKIQQHVKHTHADSLRSIVKVWSYDSSSKTGKESVLHDGDHVQSASMHNSLISIVFSDGKLKECPITNSKARNESSGELSSSQSDMGTLAQSLDPQSKLSKSLTLSVSALYGHRVQSLSASDTQAAIVVEGQLYTWGHIPDILGHPPLPDQKDAMTTPEVEDVIKGTTDEEDFLQTGIFNNQLAEYRRWHEIVCQRASLSGNPDSTSNMSAEAAEAMKTWLEYPHQARELWETLQAEWYSRLRIAGPRLVRSIHTRNFHHVRMVAVGPSHAIASTESGKLMVWGRNQHGCLGLGSKVPEGALQRLPVELCLADSLPNIDGDANSSLHEPKFKFDRRSKRAKEIAEANRRREKEARRVHLSSGILKLCCGGGHTAILLGDGSVYTWGSGHFGQLGHRDFEDQSKPKRLSLAPDHIYKKSPQRQRRGSAFARKHREKVDHLDFNWKEPPFSDVALGQDHTVVLARDGTVYTFGGNWRGQLGRHTKLEHSTVGPNHKHMLVINSLKANWSVQRAVAKLAMKARQLTKMRDSYPKPLVFHYYGAPKGGTGDKIGVVSISAHEHASAAIREDGVVFTWGRVAVPRHALDAENDPELLEDLVNGRAHKSECILGDRTCPVANDMLKCAGYWPRHVAVAEESVMAIFDGNDHSDSLKIYRPRRRK